MVLEVFPNLNESLILRHPHLANKIQLDLYAKKILTVITEGKQKVNQPLLVLCHAFLHCLKTQKHKKKRQLSIITSQSLSNQKYPFVGIGI